MSNFVSFDCSYAVLADSVHTPLLGTVDKTLTLSAVGEKKVTRLFKSGDMFVVTLERRGQTHTIVMPVEHVRYMIPKAEPNVVVPGKGK